MPLYLSVVRSVKSSGSQLGKFYPWDTWQCLETFLVIIPERIFTGTAQECYEHLQYKNISPILTHTHSEELSAPIC